MLHTLDPHSVLLSPEAYKEMNLSTSGQFGGLGIVISIRDQQLTVINPMPGTPAGRAGVRKYDRIMKIPNITAVKPQGAFYILVNISQLGLSSQNFSDRLLSKANVAVVPGVAFGDDRTVRLSYATSIDIIKKGLDRFQDFCRTL